MHVFLLNTNWHNKIEIMCHFRKQKINYLDFSNANVLVVKSQTSLGP